MKNLLITFLIILTCCCSMIKQSSLTNDGHVLAQKIHYLSDVPQELLNNLNKMGVNNSPILNEQEGQFLNLVFQTDSIEINLVGKKVAFLGSKKEYFEVTRKDSIIVGGSDLYIFSDVQKIESGGYDAAITYWKKFVIPSQKIVKTLKETTVGRESY